MPLLTTYDARTAVCGTTSIETVALYCVVYSLVESQTQVRVLESSTVNLPSTIVGMAAANGK